jgi:hypothetical protein
MRNFFAIGCLSWIPVFVMGCFSHHVLKSLRTCNLQEIELGRPPTPTKLNVEFNKDKGGPRSTLSYSRHVMSPSIVMVRIHLVILIMVLVLEWKL